MGTGLAASPQASAGREHGAGAPRVTLGRTKERKCQNRRREKGIENKRPVQSALRSISSPSFVGNTFFHLLLIDTVYTSGLMSRTERTRRQSRGAGCRPVGARGPWVGRSRPGEGVSLTHVLGIVPKCGNPWILWIWFLPTVFCRFSVAWRPVPPSLGQRGPALGLPSTRGLERGPQSPGSLSLPSARGRERGSTPTSLRPAGA